MKENVRQSIFRVCSDLVKADKAIAWTEAEKITKICKLYDIDLMDRVQSQNITTGEAFKILSTQKPKLKEEVLSLLKEIVLVDETCSREEALYLIAAEYALRNGDESHQYIFSAPYENHELEDAQIIYLESKYEEEQNDVIHKNLRYIQSSLQVAGFQFIYAPEIAKRFASADNKMLKEIISYLAPSLSEDDCDLVQEGLCEMTSSYLRNELLPQEFGVKIPLSTPIFLLKIGTGYAAGKRMAHFLCLDVEEDVIAQLDGFTRKLTSMHAPYQITIGNILGKEDGMAFSGFYKTLFNALAIRKGKRCSLIVRPYSHSQILSVNSTEYKLEIGPKEAAFYLLLIVESASEKRGLWLAQTGKDYLRYLDYIQKRYARIYTLLTGKNEAPDITDWKIRNPILSKVKKAIRDNEQIIEKESFMPQELEDESLAVTVDLEHVLIWQDREMCPITAHHEWKEVINC